eukprot:CAMPEP_0172672508 /NCGR_PEP_ID=MMETSP1074-20121228/11594_1 /TAXON_ID=2916 /ORGANISM="Ceratium fusus, Strain PA161109" /LENGTH=364 /DNA_ID=CAMNT_0013489711 /DNA_START=135 /DNA_END=1225 /DNA_ORIENTATION=-
MDKGPVPILPPSAPSGPAPEPEWGTPEQSFDVEDPKAWDFLADQGYVVISGVLNTAEVTLARSELWAAIENSSKTVCRNDPTTWGDGWPGNPSNGLLTSGIFAHSALLWRVRLAPKVHRAFEQVWSTSRLLTSFDGAGAFRPLLHEDWRTLGGWFHVDQGPEKQGLHAVQGLVSLHDASGKTGSLVVVPGSHKHHVAVAARNRGQCGRDFVRIRGDDPLLSDPKRPRPRLVSCRAGDLILWDSRTIHCNSPALEDDPAVQRRHDLLRGVAYVCMTPAHWASSVVLRNRLHAAQHGVGTTHWPHEFHPTVDPAHVPASWAPCVPLTANQRMLIDCGGVQRTWLWPLSTMLSGVQRLFCWLVGCWS